MSGNPVSLRDVLTRAEEAEKEYERCRRGQVYNAESYEAHATFIERRNELAAAFPPSLVRELVDALAELNRAGREVLHDQYRMGVVGDFRTAINAADKLLSRLDSGERE